MKKYTTKDRSCPLCGKRDFIPFWQKAEQNIVRCRRCSMVYTHPIEAALANGRFYDRMGVPFYLSPEKLSSDFAPVRFQRELRIFREWVRRGRVLDVGCSTGAFLYQLKQLGSYEVFGTDVTGAALDHAESKGIHVIRDHFLEHDFGEAPFDAITFWAVLEHLDRPADFLSKAAELLKPTGYCFVLVPNLESLATRVLGTRYRYVMPDHINYFSLATLQQLTTTRAPFKVVAHRSTHFNPIVIWQDLKGGDHRIEDSERAKLLTKTTAMKLNPLLRPLRWAYSSLEKILGALRLADNLLLVLKRR